MLSLINALENIGSGAELVGLEIDEVGTRITRIDGLVLQHLPDFIDAGMPIAIHDVNIVAQVDIMKEAPAEIIVGDEADVSEFICQLEFGGGVGDAGDKFRPAGGVFDHAQDTVFAEVNTADTLDGVFAGFACCILTFEYHLD